MRRDFKFLTPSFKDIVSSLAHENAPEEVVDENIEEDKEEVKSLAVYLREEQQEEMPAVASREASDWVAEVNTVKDRLREEYKESSGDYLFRIKRMKKYLEKIKTIVSNSGSQALQTYAYLCENALNTIAVTERQLNKHATQDLLSEVRKIRETKIEAAHKLIDLRNKVKEQIDEFDTLVDKCNAITVLISLPS
jgi:C4-dicarboxylate-specific signal transduction histidine kinase